jgi:iron complex transport system permease protein
MAHKPSKQDRPFARGTAMKVVLDLSRLLREGKISQEEFDRLSRLAARDTGSLAINILIGIGVVAVSAGVLALLLNALAVAAVGALMLAGGLTLMHRGTKQWDVLATICILVGALTLAGSIVVLGEAMLASLLLATFVLASSGAAGRSNLLVGLAVLGLAACLGASTGYMHAAYELTVTEPTLTIVLFSALALAAYMASHRLGGDYEPLALTAARVSLFLVNFGFWIGSLWGDRLLLLKVLMSHDPAIAADFSGRAVVVPPMVFIVGWALALAAVAAWAVRANRRWVVNLAAVFAVIHFYTQWFERLGATPLSVLIAGVLVLAFAAAAFKLNQHISAQAAIA